MTPERTARIRAAWRKVSGTQDVYGRDIVKAALPPLEAPDFHTLHPMEEASELTMEAVEFRQQRWRTDTGVPFRVWECEGLIVEPWGLRQELGHLANMNAM